MSTAGAMESRAMSRTGVIQTCPGKQSATKTYIMFDSVMEIVAV